MSEKHIQMLEFSLEKLSDFRKIIFGIPNEIWNRLPEDEIGVIEAFRAGDAKIEELVGAFAIMIMAIKELSEE